MERFGGLKRNTVQREALALEEALSTQLTESTQDGKTIRIPWKGIDFPEESSAVPKNTAGSNVLGFLGGFALGLLPILIVVLSFISTFYSGVSVSFESSQSLLFL